MARIIAALGLPDTARKAHVPRAGDDEGEGFDDEHKPSVLRVVGGHDALDFDPAIAARMRRLRPGPGLRLVDEDGQETAPRVDRKSGVKGKSGSVRVDLGGRRSIKKKN